MAVFNIFGENNPNNLAVVSPLNTYYYDNLHKILYRQNASPSGKSWVVVGTNVSPNIYFVNQNSGSGSQGPQGRQGATGTQGATGAQGPQGFQGAQGSQGFQGNQGNQGVQGFQGTTGAQGSQGSTGAQGPQGFQGSAGAQGSQGDQGFQGNQGTQGVQGATGSQGSQGATGSQGAQGNQGTQGNQGAQGSQGSQGSQGFQGTQGTAAPGGVYKSGDQTTAAGADTTITGLTFATSAGETRSFEAYIVGQVSGAGSARFTVVYSNAPTTSTITTFANTTAITATTTQITLATTPAQTGSVWSAATTEFSCRIYGSFTNGASANTVTIKVQPVNAGQTVTIRGNSYLVPRS